MEEQIRKRQHREKLSKMEADKKSQVMSKIEKKNQMVDMVQRQKQEENERRKRDESEKRALIE